MTNISALQTFTVETIRKGVWPEENYHGYIPLERSKEADLFYWWFPSRRSRETDPLVIWITGGPGCSGEIALFVENGPFKIDRNNPKQIFRNEWSWNNIANVLYLDQPVGTGFSTAGENDYVSDEDEIQDDFYEFMLKFFDKYSEFKGRDLYIIGESYGGHYVPNMGHKAYYNNNPDFNLKGIGIGNGLINPWVQYETAAEFALANKIIDWSTYIKLLPDFRECETMMKYNIVGGRRMCDKLYGSIVLKTPNSEFDLAGFNSPDLKFNNYDITKPCIGPLCYNFKFLDDFLNNVNILSELGIPLKKTWSECSTPVGTALDKHDIQKNSTPLLVDLLNDGVKVLIYHGELDMILNWMGGIKAAEAIDWFAQEQFRTSLFKNHGYGLKKQYDNLAYIKFSGAGHMVPMDQPENA